jgi:cold shock CspA family protein
MAATIGSAHLTGTVIDFDADRGWGRIESDDGHSFGFHCALVADGSRSVEVGRRVRFQTLAKFGRIEAAAVEPL